MATLFRVMSFAPRTATSYGGGLFGSIYGSPTFGTSNARASGSYLIISPSGAASRAGIDENTANGWTASVYFRIPTSLPTANSKLFLLYGMDGQTCYFRYNYTSNRFSMQIGTGTEQVLSSLTPSANQWYRLDMRFIANANPHTVDWQVSVDGGSSYTGPQATYNGAATTANGWRCGTDAAETYTCYYTDLAISSDVNDYPIGAHETRVLYPNLDGTHNNPANIVEDASGNDINGSTYYAYSQIQSVQPGVPDTTEYLKVNNANDGSYVEWNFSKLSSNDAPLGLCAYLAYTSATTTANNAATTILDGGTEYGVWGTPASDADYSDGSTSNLYYKSVKLLLASITKSVVDALKGRFYSGNDATPDPYLIDVWVEVAVQVSSGIPNKALQINQAVSRAATW